MRRKPARTIVWSSAMTTRTTFTPLTPTLSPVGRGGALRGSRLGLLSRPSPQPSPLWGEGERCADRKASQRRRPCAELATEHLDALAHPDQAVAARLRALW